MSKLQISYYPEQDNHIRDKVKEVLDLSNYASKNRHDTCVDTSDLAAKKVCCFESWSSQTRH